MQNQPEMAKATFYVKSEWNGGFSVASSSKGFRFGGQNIQRNPEGYKCSMIFQINPIKLKSDRRNIYKGNF